MQQRRLACRLGAKLVDLRFDRSFRSLELNLSPTLKKNRLGNQGPTYPTNQPTLHSTSLLNPVRFFYFFFKKFRKQTSLPPSICPRCRKKRATTRCKRSVRRRKQRLSKKVRIHIRDWWSSVMHADISRAQARPSSRHDGTRNLPSAIRPGYSSRSMISRQSRRAPASSLRTRSRHWRLLRRT